MFKENVIQSFRKVKKDIMAIKNNVSEWVVFYNKKNSEHEKKIEVLEQRIIFLERQLLQKKW